MARYEFLNVNPLGFKEKDCVCRAISKGINEDYYVISRKLELVAELFECQMLCECCYKHLLDYVYGLTRIEEFRGMSIEEFLKLHPNGRFIIRVPQHLTFAENGTIYDIWDCSDEIIDIIWVVK